MSVSEADSGDFAARWFILNYLHSQKLSCVHEVEKQFKLFFDVEYLRSLIINGSLQDAENYLSAFSNMQDNKHTTKVFFEIRKQKYLEALDSNKQEALKILLGDLAPFRTLNKAVFNELTELLTLSNFRDHPRLTAVTSLAQQRMNIATQIPQWVSENPALKPLLNRHNPAFPPAAAATPASQKRSATGEAAAESTAWVSKRPKSEPASPATSVVAMETDAPAPAATASHPSPAPSFPTTAAIAQPATTGSAASTPAAAAAQSASPTVSVSPGRPARQTTPSRRHSPLQTARRSTSPASAAPVVPNVPTVPTIPHAPAIATELASPPPVPVPVPAASVAPVHPPVAAPPVVAVPAISAATARRVVDSIVPTTPIEALGPMVPQTISSVTPIPKDVDMVDASPTMNASTPPVVTPTAAPLVHPTPVRSSPAPPVPRDHFKVVVAPRTLPQRKPVVKMVYAKASSTRMFALMCNDTLACVDGDDKPVQQVQLLGGMENTQSNFTLSKNGNFIVGCVGHSVHVLNARRFVVLKMNAMTDDAAVFSALCVQERDNNLIGFGTEDGSVMTYNVNSNIKSPKWRMHDARVNAVEFVDGQTLLSAGADGKLIRRGLDAASQPQTLFQQDAPLMNVILKDSAHVLLVDHRAVSLFSMMESSVLKAFHATHDIRSAALAIDGKHLYVALEGGIVQIVDAHLLTLIQTVRTGLDDPSYIATGASALQFSVADTTGQLASVTLSPA
eukprot:TRINITY_DN11862_c0_g1_i1.p1 TRINITY_DN11862_c0_g1~~TRINITY_DN11862_c0_g1_i1.p1  ORF type:complete len:735 (+),score=187.13 TRINITY_DN11862_c0_g1_i1:157-2361(+)